MDAAGQAGEAFYRVAVRDETEVALEAIIDRFERFGAVVGALLDRVKGTSAAVNQSLNEMVRGATAASGRTSAMLGRMAAPKIESPPPINIRTEGAEVAAATPGRIAGAWNSITATLSRTTAAVKQLGKATAEMANEVSASTDHVATAIEGMTKSVTARASQVATVAGQGVTAYRGLMGTTAQAGVAATTSAAAFGGFGATLKTAAAYVAGLVKALFSFIAAHPIALAVILAIVAALYVFSDALRPLGAALLDLGAYVVQVVGVIGGAMLRLVKFLTLPLQLMLRFVGTTLGFLVMLATAGPRAVLRFADALRKLPGAILGGIRATLAGAGALIGSGLSSAFAAGWKFIKAPGRAIFQPLADGVTAITAAVASRLRAAGETVSHFGNQVVKIGGVVAALGAAVVGPMTMAGKAFVEFAQHTTQAADSVQMGTANYQSLDYAAGKLGTSIDECAKSIMVLDAETQAAAKGNGTAEASFDRLGLKLQNLIPMDTEERFLTVAEAIAKVKGEAERADLAEKLLGGSSALLLFEKGAAGLKAMREEAAALGKVLTPEQTRMAGETGRVFAQLKDALAGIKIQLGAIIGGELKATTERLLAMAKITIRWIKEHREMIFTAFKVASAVSAVGAAVATIGGIISGAGTALGGLAAIVTAAGGALAFLLSVLAAILSPVVLIVAAVSALGGGLLVVFNPLAMLSGLLSKVGTAAGDFRTRMEAAARGAMQTLRELLAWAKEVFGGINAAILAGKPELAAAVVFAALRVAWVRGMAELQTLTNKTFGGMFAELGAGNYAAAFEQLGNAIKIAFTSAMQHVWPLWTKLQNVIDDVLTGLRVSFAGMVDFIGAGVQKLLTMLSNTAAKIGKYDPTGKIKGLALDAQLAAGNLLRDLKGTGAPPKPKSAEQQKLLDDSAKRIEDRNTALTEQLANQERALEALRAARDEAATRGEDANAKRLEQLSAELAAAVAAAHAAQDAAKLPEFAALKRSIDAGEKKITASEQTTQGAFSSAEKLALGTGQRKDKNAEATAEATQATARNTEKLIGLWKPAPAVEAVFT